jgi:hypothetical protein
MTLRRHSVDALLGGTTVARPSGRPNAHTHLVTILVHELLGLVGNCGEVVYPTASGDKREEVAAEFRQTGAPGDLGRDGTFRRGFSLSPDRTGNAHDPRDARLGRLGI